MSSKRRSSNRLRKNNTNDSDDDDKKKNNERTTLKGGFGQRSSCERTHPHRHHHHRAKKKMKKNKSGERVEEEEDTEGENGFVVQVAPKKKFNDEEEEKKDASMTVVRNPLFKKWTKDSITFDGRTFRVANEEARKEIEEKEKEKKEKDEILPLEREEEKESQSKVFARRKERNGEDDDFDATDGGSRIIPSHEQQTLSPREQKRFKLEEQRKAYNAFINRGRKGRPRKDEMETNGVILCKMCENEQKNEKGSKFRKYFCCDACVLRTSSTFVPSIGVSVLFCQQCRKPHLIDEFEYGMKSCQKSLNVHRIARLKRAGKYDDLSEGRRTSNGDAATAERSSTGEKRARGSVATRKNNANNIMNNNDDNKVSGRGEEGGSFVCDSIVSEESLEDVRKQQQNLDKEHVKSIGNAFRNERDQYTEKIGKYGLEQAAFDKALVGGSTYNPVAKLVIPDISPEIFSVFPPALTKSDRLVFHAMRKTAYEADIEMEVRRSWELNQASEDGVHVKVQNASPPDLHPDLVHFVRDALRMEPLAIGDGGEEAAQSPRAGTTDGKDLPHDNNINDLLGTVRPGCVSFSFWVSDPQVLETEFAQSIFHSGDNSLFNRLRAAFVKGVRNSVQDEKTKATVVIERGRNSVSVRHRNIEIMTKVEKMIGAVTKPQVFHVSARSVLSGYVASIAIIGANLLGENSYLNIKFNDEVQEVCLDPEVNTTLEYSVLQRDEHMDVTPVMIRTYVRFNKSAFSSRNKKNTSNGGVDTALLSSVASLFQASSSKVKLATLQIVRDCNASEAEPIVVTTSKRIHREIHANFCSREDPQVMGTITRRAFLSCAKNCEDERVATGVVTKCTIDAMDALNLRALANELRRLDRERFYVSIQKALANVCDPYAEVLLSGFLFASANKFYRKVREIASPEAYAKLRKKLFLLHAPNIFFVALMLLMYYSSVARTSLYSKMRERFFLAMRIHAMFYGWYSTHAATSVVFESANATVDSDTKHLKLVRNFRCPQLLRFSGFIVVVVMAAIISLMHSARPTWDVTVKILHTALQVATAVWWQCTTAETIVILVLVVSIQGILTLPMFWTQKRAWKGVWMAHPYQIRMQKAREVFSVGGLANDATGEKKNAAVTRNNKKAD